MKIEIKQDAKLLDFVLDYFPQVSVTKAKKMILYNCFSMQCAALKSWEYILHKGDTIEYTKYSGGQHIAKEKRNVSVLYEDRDIIIVNKSSGQSVTEYKNKKEDTLLSMTKSYLKKKYHKNDLFVVYAPQTDESGICIMAKSKLALNWLEKQSESFKFNIAAIVENKLKHKNDKIRFYIIENNGIYSVCDKNDEAAREVFLQYSTVEDLSLGDDDFFQINITQTGIKPYMNRYLLASIGNPVYGDNTFNAVKHSGRILRYCVYSVEMLRPSTNKRLKIETALPRNFVSVRPSVKQHE
ncbi:MAG: hypothetical protein J6P44_08910 [Bacteroidales bacterium]|nr:hypothetical protein [Bacteroidales bacterium]